MGKEMLIRMLVAMLGEYLIKPGQAAPYKKYLLRGRDYLLLLFPLDRYPEGEYSETNVRDKATFAVPGGIEPAPKATTSRKGK